ncbi:hypothetical protein E2I00_011311, partial [Balaenoptera physalus]
MPVLERQKLQWEPSSLKMQTVQRSQQTLETALISKNPALTSSQTVISLDPLLCICNQIGSPPILRLPKTLKSFSNDPYRKIPSPEKCSIYIQCIGSLGNTRIISEKYIKWLKGYCKAFFYGLTVRLLEPVPISTMRCSFRVNKNTQNLQLLKEKGPEDAFCAVEVTMIDLYPRDSWNFAPTTWKKLARASSTFALSVYASCRVLFASIIQKDTKWIDDQSADTPGITLKL